MDFQSYQPTENATNPCTSRAQATRILPDYLTQDIHHEVPKVMVDYEKQNVAYSCGHSFNFLGEAKSDNVLNTEGTQSDYVNNNKSNRDEGLWSQMIVPLAVIAIGVYMAVEMHELLFLV